jgi:hypothetical protein
MAKMFPCERISESFTETAPYRFTAVRGARRRGGLAPLGECDHQRDLDEPRAPRLGTTRTVDMRGDSAGRTTASCNDLTG